MELIMVRMDDANYLLRRAVDLENLPMSTLKRVEFALSEAPRFAKLIKESLPALIACAEEAVDGSGLDREDYERLTNAIEIGNDLLTQWRRELNI